jgi:hypothetical protein
MNPTVEADFSNISGLKDIYAQSDAGVWLVAQNFNFNASTVYDGYWHLPGVMQAELFVTNPGVGPFGDRVVGKSTAATALCPTYDPVYDAHMVAPTPPAGSVPIEFLHIQWYANN